MKSRYKSTCPGCNQPIFKGDDIVKAGSGRWVHKICPVSNEEESYDDSAEELEPEIKVPKTVQCLRCGNQSFLKKRLHSVKLDNGDTLTSELFICEKCYFKMEFVVK